MTSQEIRQQFIDFFVQKHGHTFVPSSPVVPHDDPTLLFTNAGMNQFKPIFLGLEKRSYTRAANTQKCIRAGGKHNDLDDVGRSRRHHTFFEMLGNWSFGDYFKREAIAWSWELLTKVWKLDPTRLHVTVHAGDEAIGVQRDNEAAQIWRDIGVPDDHIHYGNTKDNFWEMGDTGPCGPCTEIYVDRTPDGTGGPSVLSGDEPRVMEIWNNVFIQYNRRWNNGGEAAVKAFDSTRAEPLPGEDVQAARDRIRKHNFGTADRATWVAKNSTLEVLPAKHVDTGMGLERIIQVLQGKGDNYAIDLFDPFWAKLKELSGITYGGKYPKSNSADPAAEASDIGLRHDIAFRVIGDHIRCLTFAITDGAVPSNEGRGYVLRRILRRAVRFGRQQLELQQPFLHEMVPVVVEAMGAAFPELKKDPKRVAEIIKDEEISFGKTLDRGIELFGEVATAFTQMADAARKFNLNVTAWTDRSIGRILPQMEAIWAKQAELGGGRANVGPRAVIVSSDSNDVQWAKRAWNHYRDFYDATNVEITAKGMARWYSNPDKMPAEAAFKLHDTFGFPIDLTRIMAEERGMSVDIAGYEKLMEEAKDLARAGGKDQDTRLFELPPDVIAKLQKAGVKPTDDSAKYLGQPIAAKVVALWDGSQLIESVDDTPDRRVAVLLDRTNHYSEMGGQVGDQGGLRMAEGLFSVETARVIAGYVLHVGQMLSCGLNGLRVGDEVTVNLSNLREKTQQNHTTTHLANWALREVLGDDVQQKGSLVDPEKLRFDFSHGKALSDDEIGRVETLVNAGIAKKLPVYAETAPQEQALKIHGLRAVFGEKYPPMVRVVSIGVPVKDLLADPTNAKWRQFSIEFCGGTHLKNTSDAEAFAVIGEESVSKGIRRIVALTGDSAKSANSAVVELDNQIAKARGMAEDALPPQITALQKTIQAGNLPLLAKRRGQAAVAELQAKVKAWEKAHKTPAGGAKIDIGSTADELLGKSASLGGGKLVIADIAGATDDQLRGVFDSIRKKSPSYAVMLASVIEDRVSFIAAVSDDLIAKGLKAGDWIRETAKVAGGGGGGKPQMAQAGGKDPSKLKDALERAREFAKGIMQ